MEQYLSKEDLIKINDFLYEIPVSYRDDMLVPARIFVNEQMLDQILEDRSLWQIVNVATLPGIQKAAFAMPDIHEGYGFPIGGVAAMSIKDNGVISPGGIGYDINCGVRLLVANEPFEKIKPQIEKVANEIFQAIPSGVGKGGELKLNLSELDEILVNGAKQMVAMGYGTQDDVDCCEGSGCMAGADPRSVTRHAKERGKGQLGTLGSGNHFLEIQKVEEIFEPDVAKAFGLKVGDVTVMIHCGSRGLGHQTCTDHVKIMVPKMQEWGIHLPDRELACAPFNSHEGQEYFSAMNAAANYAWANRHLIGHNVRQAWQRVFGSSSNLKTVYDVAHNVGKREVHTINRKQVDVIIHRKGATRAFGPGMPEELPEVYKHVGHPVFIPGTMGTASYVLVGTDKGMEQSFGSTCHGAGRCMSRREAKRTVRGSELRQELERKGIVICCPSDPGLAEEAPLAYKDVHNVVDVVVGAQIAKKVARLVPIAVIKGN